MESKSTEQLSMDLPPYSVYPKLVDTKKKWTVGVCAALLLALIIVAGTLAGAYMTQKHIEQVLNQGTLPREMTNSSYKFKHLHKRDLRKMLDICFDGNPKRVTRQSPTQDSFYIPISHVALAVGGEDILIDIQLSDFALNRGPVCAYLRDNIRRRSTESNQHEEKSPIKLTVKCDEKKENITGPVVIQQVDYIVSLWMLKSISKNEDEYRRSLKKIIEPVKPGGHVILSGATNASYSTAGKYHHLSDDKRFLRNASVEEGTGVVHIKIYPTKFENKFVYLEVVLIPLARELK